MATESAVRIIFLGDSAQAVRSVSRLESSFASLGTAAKLGAAAIGIAMVGAMAAATKAAVDFDRSMRNVNSIAKLSEKQFQDLSRRVLALAGPTAQAPKVLADGLYDIVSSGFKANDAIKILAVSAKAATAGMTDTATASKAVVAVLNAYHLSADKAKNVSSLLFTEVNKGVNTFEELATNIGDTAPLAASLQIPFSDVAAGLALITLHGTSMAEAATQMSRVMADLLKPSKDLSAELKSLGYENGQAAIQAHGFIPLITQLSEAAKGSSATTADWFQNIRSLRGMLNLTGPNLAKFNEFANEMAASFRKGGADVAAFNEQAKSISVQWAMAKDALIAAAIPLGQLLFPALAKTAGAVASLAEAINRYMPQIQAVTGAVARAIGQAWDTYAIPPLKSFEGEVRKMAQEVRQNWPQISAQARATSASVRSALHSMGQALQDLRPLLHALGPEFKAAFAIAIFAIRALAFEMQANMKVAAVAIHIVAPVVAALVSGVNRGFGEMAQAAKGLASAFTSAFNAIVGPIKTVIHWIQTLISWIGRIPHDISIHLHLPSLPSGGSGGLHIPGTGIPIPPILPASGGIVPLLPGTTKGADSVPALLTPGEMVLNAHQQAMLGGPAYLAGMFNFGQMARFAAGGIAGHTPRRRHASKSPHSSRHRRSPVKARSKAVKAILGVLEEVDENESNADRAYGQLVRQFDITQEQFIRTDPATGQDYLSKPDIDQRVSEIDQLITARNNYLALLDEEKKELELAIQKLKAAIAALVKAIKREREQAAEDAKAIRSLGAQLGHTKDAKARSRIQNQITARGNSRSKHLSNVGTLQGTLGDFQGSLKDVQENLGDALPMDVRDVSLDISTLQAERKDVVGTTLPASGAGGGVGGDRSAEIAALLAQIAQLNLALGIQGAQSAIIGSFARGTLSVPETGLALVHAGEQITPAGQVRGGRSVSEPAQVNVYVDDAMAWLKPYIRAEAVNASDAISVRIGQRATERARSGRF